MLNYLNLFPWWGWFLCGIGGFLLARFVGRFADDHGSVVAEIGRLLLGFAAVVSIVIGVLVFVY